MWVSDSSYTKSSVYVLVSGIDVVGIGMTTSGIGEVRVSGVGWS